jgi:hypothetical protein
MEKPGLHYSSYSDFETNLNWSCSAWIVMLGVRIAG